MLVDSVNASNNSLKYDTIQVQRCHQYFTFCKQDMGNNRAQKWRYSVRAFKVNIRTVYFGLVLHGHTLSKLKHCFSLVLQV